MAFHPLLLLSLIIAVTYFNIFINFPLHHILHASFLISSLNTYLDPFPLAFLSSDLTFRKPYYFPSHFLSLCFVCNSYIKKRFYFPALLMSSQKLEYFPTYFTKILEIHFFIVSIFFSIFFFLNSVKFHICISIWPLGMKLQIYRPPSWNPSTIFFYSLLYM